MSDNGQISKEEIYRDWHKYIKKPIPKIRFNLLVKYYNWYRKAKIEHISILGFFNGIEQVGKHISKDTCKIHLSEGTKIKRSYKGEIYEIETVSNGYVYKGKVYKSLSGIAKEITGKNWNGKIFFGVKR